MVVVLNLLAGVRAETVFGVILDNTVGMFADNKLSCRDDLTRRLLQELSSSLDAVGHNIIVSHVRHHRNEHADTLSHAIPAGW